MSTIVVKAAHPTANFYQEVLDDAGEPKIEHVIAHTADGGRQVPVPIEIQDTLEVRRALAEIDPVTKRPSRIVEVKGDELRAYQAGGVPTQVSHLDAPPAGPVTTSPTATSSGITPGAQA